MHPTHCMLAWPDEMRRLEFRRGGALKRGTSRHPTARERASPPDRPGRVYVNSDGAHRRRGGAMCAARP
jgi:hypothetical protein